MSELQKKTIDFSRSAISRYVQLATLFRQRIDSGVWPVGSQMPTVEELSDEYGVARATIRQALTLLEDDGLIERFRAKGTFVRRRPQEELWCAVGTDWSGLLQPSHTARIEVLEQQTGVVLDNAPYMIGEFAPHYWSLRRRHWRHDQPFLLTNVHIDERLKPAITQNDIETKTALRLVHDIDGLDIVDAQQTLTIGTADVETAEALSIPLNAPVAYVYRRAVDSNGIAVLIAQGIYDGQVVRFDIKLR